MCRASNIHHVDVRRAGRSLNWRTIENATPACWIYVRTCVCVCIYDQLTMETVIRAINCSNDFDLSAPTMSMRILDVCACENRRIESPARLHQTYAQQRVLLVSYHPAIVRVWFDKYVNGRRTRVCGGVVLCVHMFNAAAVECCCRAIAHRQHADRRQRNG